MVRASEGGFISNRRERFDRELKRNVQYQLVRWSFTTLAPGEKRHIEIVLQTTNSGKLDHLVLATADRNLEQRAQVHTEFEEATKNRPIPPVIYGHNAGIGVKTRGIFREVIDLLARLDGIDFRQTGPVRLEISA